MSKPCLGIFSHKRNKANADNEGKKSPGVESKQQGDPRAKIDSLFKEYYELKKSKLDSFKADVSKKLPEIQDFEQFRSLVSSIPTRDLDKFPDSIKKAINKLVENNGNTDSELSREKLLKNFRKASLKARETTLKSLNSRAYNDILGNLDKNEMQDLAEKTAEVIRGMSPEDWKSMGFDGVPDFRSSDLNSVKILDKLLCNRGIKEADLSEIKKNLEPTKTPNTTMSKQSKKSQEFLSESNEKTNRESEDSVGLKPDTIAKQLLSLVMKNKLRQAEGLFQKALLLDRKRIGFDPVTCDCFNIMISAYCFENMPIQAGKTFDLMQKLGHQPSVQTFNSFMQLSAQAQNRDRLQYWYNKLRESNLKPDAMTYNILIGVATKENDSTSAIDYFQKMKRDVENPDATAYGHLIEMYGIRRRDFEEALKWILRMQEDGVQRNTYIKRVILKMHAEWKKEQEREKAKSVQEVGTNLVSTLINAIYSCNVSSAEKIWYELKQSGCVQAEHYTLMIQLYLAVSKLSAAKKIYEEMIGQGHEPTRTTLALMVDVSKKSGDILQAQRYISMLDQDQDKEKQRIE
ncbi:uncharacterized protein LOC126324475 [Schistocerca gregaria]|uniref:uncharacterized protein LOC126324475 n=1 Tax=Schistocerca gregaria TaxID=7010 RepID=UPI00211E4443|nr:uncharacterized protein LOC126324475 [Schistocerca gregaria]